MYSDVFLASKEVYAFSGERELNIASRYSIGCSVNGFNQLENEDPKERVMITTEGQLLKMLELGRCDYYLVPLDVLNYWNDLNGTDIKSSKLVKTYYLRLRLNKRHEHLLAPINAMLRALKNSGELAAMIQKHLKRAPL